MANEGGEDQGDKQTEGKQTVTCGRRVEREKELRVIVASKITIDKFESQKKKNKRRGVTISLRTGGQGRPTHTHTPILLLHTQTFTKSA